MIATNIKQSKRLLKLGLDPNSADMFWHDDILRVGNSVGMNYPNVFPAWSLDALLDLIPMVDLYRMPTKEYVCAAFQKDGWRKSFGKTSIEAAYEMVVWLLENNYIRTKDNG